MELNALLKSTSKQSLEWLGMAESENKSFNEWMRDSAPFGIPTSTLW